MHSFTYQQKSHLLISQPVYLPTNHSLVNSLTRLLITDSSTDLFDGKIGQII